MPEGRGYFRCRGFFALGFSFPLLFFASVFGAFFLFDFFFSVLLLVGHEYVLGFFLSLVLFLFLFYNGQLLLLAVLLACTFFHDFLVGILRYLPWCAAPLHCQE